MPAWHVGGRELPQRDGRNGVEITPLRSAQPDVSVYCVLWAGKYKGLAFVHDGEGVQETLADPPSVIFPTPAHLAQGTFDFEEAGEMSKMHTGDRIISTCGSLYRGCEGVITQVHSPGAHAGWTEYSVNIVINAQGEPFTFPRQCHFDGSQFVRIEADLGREHDKPCRSCCCRLGGHTSEVLP